MGSLSTLTTSGTAPLEIDPRFLSTEALGDQIGTDALPIGRAGALTVVAAPERGLPIGTVRALEAKHGPVALLPTTRQARDTAIASVLGPELAGLAERRTAAQESCRDWSGLRTASIVLTLLALVLAAALVWPAGLILFLTSWAVVTLLAVTGLRTAAAIVEHRAKGRKPYPIRPLKDHALPVISVLVPLFREREIAERLIARLSQLDYPKAQLDLILVLEDDDALTHAAISDADIPNWMRVLPVPRGTIRTKPRALNYALDFARGDIVGVYDAEDWPAPDQLRKVAAHFDQAAPDVACLQGVLDFYNARQNWLTRCFTIDYATWFGLILPGLARLRMVIPLGGTTLFFRADVLRALGRWDAHNVTEDADLGLRLARRGFRTEFLNSVTEEEATSSIPAWIKQRSRWIKGYAVTWAVHMRSPLRLWGELGTLKFLGVQILFFGTLSQFLLAPLLWSFWLVVFGYPHPFADVASPGLILAVTVLFFAAEILTIGINALAVSSAKHRRLIFWVPLMHLYFPLAAIASWKGFSELITRPFYWDKTRHGFSSTTLQAHKT